MAQATRVGCGLVRMLRQLRITAVAPVRRGASRDERTVPVPRATTSAFIAVKSHEVKA